MRRQYGGGRCEVNGGRAFPLDAGTDDAQIAPNRFPTGGAPGVRRGPPTRESPLNRLHRFSIRHPVLVVAIAIAATAAIAPGILRLRLRTDGHALVPEKAPAVRFDRALRSEFGIRDPLVVLVRSRHPDGIFNPRTLHLVADLTADLARLPGLDSASVRSLATEPSDRFRPGTLTYRRFLEPVPDTPGAIAELRGDLEAIGLHTGTLVSFDHEATAIFVLTPPDADRTALVAAVENVVAGADTAGHEVRVIGAPAAEALLGSHILEDLGVSWRLLGQRPRRFAGRPEQGLGALSRMRLAIARHIGLLPLSVVIMGLVFLLFFRSLAAALLPLAEAGACLLFVFGLMGWTGVPVYLTMAVLPVILVSMGLADEIHIFSCYARRRAERPGEPIADTVRAAMDEMSLPVIATSLTTAVGFLSFAITPLAPVRAFGLLTAAGILFCMLWTLTVIPALLVLLAPPGFRAARAAGAAEAWWRGFGAWLGRRPAWTLGLAVLALALMPLGLRRLTVQDSWIEGFAHDSAFYRATQYFNQRFFGTHLLLLVLDTGHVDLHGRVPVADLRMHEIRLPSDLVSDPGRLVGCSVSIARRLIPPGADSLAGFRQAIQRWWSFVESAARKGDRIVVTTPPYHGSALFLFAPAAGETLEYALASQGFALPRVLRRIEGLERFVRAQTACAVGGVLGPASQIATAEFIVSDRAPGWRRIPDDPGEVRGLWEGIGWARGRARLREIVDPKLERGLVTVFLKNANFADTARLMDEIRRYQRQYLESGHIRLDFAGDVAVSQTLIQAIVASQTGSLLLSLFGILAVTALLFRSLRWGVLCVIPAGFSVGVTFAVMGWVGMPLGVATSMFAGMALGIGVDFAIHLAQRYRVTVGRGVAREAAVVDAIAATGPAIVVNALAVALGFGILVLSQVPANTHLGAITVVSLVTCLAATLLVIPALLRVGAGGRDS
jgi:predicted RND superfamily exporter protein